MKNLITTFAILFVATISIAQNAKISDYAGEWKTDKEFSYGSDEMTITTNRYVKIKTGITGSCPYVFEYKNAKYDNGKITVTRVQYDSGGATSDSKANFELKNGKLYVTDYAKYGCGDKILIFSKKANPIDKIIGVYKMDDKDYRKHMTALIGNYGKYLEISKIGNSIKISEYDLNNSTKTHIKHKYYKYNESNNTISGINYMQDEYDRIEKKYKLSFKENKIVRNQEWWGFPDNLILNYNRI